MLNPIRSEAEAFRLVLYVLATFLVITVVVLVARAIF
jgi:hypothetical protein